MSKLHLGYKRYTVIDENGLILAEDTTAANESDIKHFEILLSGKTQKSINIFPEAQ